MAIIGLTEPKVITEGVHDFKITKVEYEPTFQKLKVTLTTEDGINVPKMFAFLNAQGETNTAVMNIFSWFSRVAMKQNDLKQIDPDMLVGRFISAKVEKQTYTKTDGTTGTGNQLSDYKECDGWETTTTKADVDDLLGDLFG